MIEQDVIKRTGYVRMVIGETISDEQATEFIKIFNADTRPSMEQEPGYLFTQILHEDGGNMIVMVTGWQNRDHALRYHSSRQYRQFIAKTQHLLLGNFVIKMFSER